MILVDTSVWIEFFRKGTNLALDEWIERDDVVTCAAVVQEVLQGFRDEFVYRRARKSLLNLPIVDVPVPLALYEEAAQIYRSTRRAGMTIRSSVDCLIAASAIRHNLELLHGDRDFEQIARITALRAVSIWSDDE